MEKIYVERSTVEQLDIGAIKGVVGSTVSTTTIREMSRKLDKALHQKVIDPRQHKRMKTFCDLKCAALEADTMIKIGSTCSDIDFAEHEGFLTRDESTFLRSLIGRRRRDMKPAMSAARIKADIEKIIADNPPMRLPTREELFDKKEDEDVL